MKRVREAYKPMSMRQRIGIGDQVGFQGKADSGAGRAANAM
jgi:hypothetical protein